MVSKEAARFEFRLLGPFEVLVDGQPLNVGGPQLRGVLARLLVDAGRTVSLDALVAELWGEHAPADANRTTRTYISRLRNTLRRAGAEDLVATSPPGYQLRVEPEVVDAARFERLTATGRQALAAGDARTAYDRFTEALELWRGTAYAGFDELRVVAGEAARLDGLRLAAVEDRVEAMLAAGLDGEAVAELEVLARAHPTRERLWGQLMTALYRSGRQADALSAFREIRENLVDEYGVEPSPALTTVHQRILQHELASPSSGFPTPAQLPNRVRDFTGRTAELAQLDALLPTGGAPELVLAAVSGTAGVGKTALVVHWAHRVSERFPDGQLYVNLCGFDPGSPALDPADVVRGFLDAFGVAAERIPASPQARAALYRSVLVGKRVLVVLDNARDVEQVRPLLPGSAGCLVVVTSRNQLTPLVATEGAYPVNLDLLTGDEARALVRHRLGSVRAAVDPGAVDQIVARCVGLPLALAIATARLAAQPGLPLSVLASELGDATGLDALTAGDANTDVRSVFSWSYRTLSPPAARLFRLLGLHTAPDIATPAAASIAGIPPERARALLAELCRAHLLTEDPPGRYACHDLLRAYAAEQAYLGESREGQREAIGRLLDHYLHTGYSGAHRLGPHLDTIAVGQRASGVTADPLATPAAAVAWFAAERRGLVAAVHQAYGLGLDRHAWQLAWTFAKFANRRNLWADLTVVSEVAVTAARRLGDRAGEAHARQGLGLAYRGVGAFDVAQEHLAAALDLFDQAGDKFGKSRTHENLAWIAGAQERFDDALDEALLSLELCRASGNTVAEGIALNNVGWYQARLGQYDEALMYCHQALDLQRRADDPYPQAHTWDSLGYIYRHLYDREQTVTCYARALEIFRQSGDVYSEAIGLTYLGDALADAGDPHGAWASWQEAATLLDQLHHPFADEVRRRAVE